MRAAKAVAHQAAMQKIEPDLQLIVAALKFLARDIVFLGASQLT
jgi:hypothetical protein